MDINITVCVCGGGDGQQSRDEVSGLPEKSPPHTSTLSKSTYQESGIEV